MKRLAGALLALALTAAPAFAADADAVEADLIEAWYAAVTKPDRKAAGDLLAPDALIVLDDLGVMQTKAEFLAAFGEWEAALAKGGELRHRADPQPDGKLAYLACYRFPSNEALVRERFEVSAGLITRSVQQSVADNCNGF